MHLHVYSMHMHRSSSGGTAMQFENQVVLITGGGGGMGRAEAQRFLDEGARIRAQRRLVRPRSRHERDALDPTGEPSHPPGQVTTREQAQALVAAADRALRRVKCPSTRPASSASCRSSSRPRSTRGGARSSSARPTGSPGRGRGADRGGHQRFGRCRALGGRWTRGGTRSSRSGALRRLARRDRPRRAADMAFAVVVRVARPRPLGSALSDRLVEHARRGAK